MKKFIYSFLLLFVSSQSLVAAGYMATYSLNVSNPAAYVEAMDDLMELIGKIIPCSSDFASICFQLAMTMQHILLFLIMKTLKVWAKELNHFHHLLLKVFSKASEFAEPVGSL